MSEQPADPTDDEIESRLREAPIDRWNALWITLDGLEHEPTDHFDRRGEWDRWSPRSIESGAGTKRTAGHGSRSAARPGAPRRMDQDRCVMPAAGVMPAPCPLPRSQKDGGTKRNRAKTP